MQRGCWKDASPCKMHGCSTVPVHQPRPAPGTDILPTLLVFAQMTAGTGCSTCPIARPPRAHQRALFQIDSLRSERVQRDPARLWLALPRSPSPCKPRSGPNFFFFFFPGRLLTSRQSTTSGWRAANLPAALAQTRCHQHFAAAASSAALRVFPCSLNAHPPSTQLRLRPPGSSPLGMEGFSFPNTNITVIC